MDNHHNKNNEIKLISKSIDYKDLKEDFGNDIFVKENGFTDVLDNLDALSKLKITEIVYS